MLRQIRTLPLFSSIIFGLCCNIGGPKNLEVATTVEELWNQYPDRARTLLKAFDHSSNIGLKIDKTLALGDTIEACRQIVDYYQTQHRDWVIGTLDTADREVALATAGRLLNDTVELDGKIELIPKNDVGGWQWSFNGTVPDDEIGYSLNGHKYLPVLYFAHQKKGGDPLVRKFDRIMSDWIIQHPLPGVGDSIYLVLDSTSSIDWRDIGEVEWRTLETGNRLGASWAALFYAFQPEESFSDATRLLMLSSLVDQANYLHRYHKSKHNWTTMEMNGLALTGLAFPEFRQAEAWTAYALQVMDDEINRQVYPDGVQTEISSKTQWVALHRFESVADHFAKANRPVSGAYMQKIEDMYHYLAYSMRPDGHQPLNNDSDREDLRPRVLAAAERFDRPDWLWIASNGAEGLEPSQAPCVVFPWGGMCIIRSGWDSLAHWSFFDIGPYGTGHQHRDALHISISAFGRDLLVDGGRYTHQDYFSFDPATWRGYFRSSFSHNVILIDGHGQKAGPLVAEKPLVEHSDYLDTDQYFYARGAFIDGFEGVEGAVAHRRSLFYLKNKYWLVIDQIDADRPHSIEVLWHFAPDCQIMIEGLEALTTNSDKGNLRLVPLGENDWHTEIIEGRSEPTIQGWYSKDYGQKVPNATVQYSKIIDQSTIFAWLLIADQGLVPKVEANLLLQKEMIVFETEEGRIDLPIDGNPSAIRLMMK
ncbi:MAG: alginate lyase family protein [Saprospiraceae bacterium]|nr:alginate lyase family protein [Saprospiraceae bacterium]